MKILIKLNVWSIIGIYPVTLKFSGLRKHERTEKNIVFEKDELTILR